MNSFAHDVLQPLIRGSAMERDDAAAALREILAGRVDGPLIASFLTALTMKGETVQEMTGFVDAMMEAATRLSLPRDAIDIVGTGGDQLHTVNVSTMAALTVAGCGVPVAKHGNRAASSSVGSADVLEGLGVKLDIGPDVIAHCLREANMAFIFAPTYHHALAHLGPIRRALTFRTVFNVLGPLANPAEVQLGVIGVASESLLEPMAQVLLARRVTKMIVVHGHDGLDELSLGTSSSLHTVTEAGVERSHIDGGAEIGRSHAVAALRGGDTRDNVAVVRSFLDAQPGPVFDVVCANAALALIAAQRVANLADGFEMAAAAVTSGRAREVLERLVSSSNAG